MRLSEDSTGGEDGRLNLPEIYNLKLNETFVILSACESGFGKIIQGEGARSLARGFRYAGASAVMMSLWQIEDKTSRMFMDCFYEAFAKKGNSSAAIQQARKQFLAEAPARYQHPFYWGALVMEGEYQKRNPANRPLMFVFGAFVLLLGGWAWRRQKRGSTRKR